MRKESDTQCLTINGINPKLTLIKEKACEAVLENLNLIILVCFSVWKESWRKEIRNSVIHSN